MEEYNAQIKDIENGGFENYVQSMNSLKEWSEASENSQYVMYYQFEIQILRLVEKRHLVINSSQPFLVDRSTEQPLELVEDQQLDYYKVRLDRTNISFLKCLYGNFLYDYSTSKHGLNKYLSSEAIFSSIRELIKQQEYSGLLGRYLQLAVRMNNLEQEKWLLNFICEEIVKSNNNTSTLSTYLKILAHAKKPMLTTDDQDQKILGSLDGRIQEAYDKKKFSSVRDLLRSKLILLGITSEEPQSDINVDIGKSYLSEANEATTMALKIMSLEDALRAFKDCGEKPKIAKTKVLLKEAYEKYDKSDEFSEFHFEVELSDKEQQQRDEFVERLANMDIAETLKNLANTQGLIPSRENTLSAAKQVLKDNPLLGIFPRTLIGNNRKIATYATAEEQLEYEYYRIYEYSLQFQMMVYLNPIFEIKENRGELTTEVFMDVLRDNRLIDSRNIPIISVGIERYLQHDFVSAMHILAPQFESTLRRVFENAGYPTTSLGSNLTQKEQTFNAFLKREDVKAALGEDVHQAIEFIMVEQTGFNLRNNIGHGLMSIDQMTKECCVLILYLFLVITRYAVKGN